jgi:hypothetical protein
VFIDGVSFTSFQGGHTYGHTVGPQGAENDIARLIANTGVASANRNASMSSRGALICSAHWRSAESGAFRVQPDTTAADARGAATAITLATLDTTSVTISTRFAPAKDYARTVGQDLEFAFIAVGD